MCNLHWCYTFCTGVTLFALVLHLNCTALSQSESSNFFMYIISSQITIANTDSDLKVRALHYANELLVRVSFPFKNFCKLAQHAEAIRKYCLGKE